MSGRGTFCDFVGRTYEGTFEDDLPVRSVDKETTADSADVTE